MKKLLAAISVLVLLTGCTVPSLPGSSNTPSRVCVDKFINSFKQGKADGVWNCATIQLQAAWFDKNSQAVNDKDPNTKYRAWNSDEDITLWLQGLTGAYKSVDVQEFTNDPVPVVDKDGNTTGYEYHIVVWVQYQDGTYSPSQHTFVITTDANGKYVSVY